MKRLISGLVATALLSFAPVAAVAGSASAESSLGGVESAQKAPQAEKYQAEAQTRRIRNFRECSNGNKLAVCGKVGGGYKNSKVIVKQSKNGPNGNFRRYSVVKTNGKGQFRARVAAPGQVGKRFHYFLLVPKRGKFSAARTPVFNTFSRRG